MSKKDLLSIGEFSKLTNISSKSLIYYEKIGILLPVYVDPDSGYRYYNPCQIELAWLIKLFVQAGIPCRELTGFISSEEEPAIRYDMFLSHGFHLVRDRLSHLQKLMDVLNRSYDEMLQGRIRGRDTSPAVHSFSAVPCYRIPFDGDWWDDDFWKQVSRIIEEFLAHGIDDLFYYGLMLQREEDEWRQYLFVSMTNTDLLMSSREFYTIPAGDYLCGQVTEPDIRQALNWRIPGAGERRMDLILEKVFPKESFSYTHPVLELHCHLTEE